MKKPVLFVSSVQKELSLERKAVREAIVNAVTHRDYTSNASVQVMLFADRVEVWNPGELLPPLTAESLRKPHRSILRNSRIAEALYLAHYIEKYGAGTLMMIRESVAYALPEPRFGVEQPGEFGVTVWRDWLTEEVMDELGLNDRQKAAVSEAKTGNGISNRRYREFAGGSESTSLRELRQLADLGVLNKVGGTGRSAHYVVAKAKPVINPSSGINQQTRQKPVKPVHIRPAVASTSLSGSTRIAPQVGTKSAPSRRQVEAHDKDHEAHDEGQTRGKANSKPTRSATQSPSQSSDPVTRLLIALRGGVLSPQALRQAVGLTHRPTFRMNYLRPALKAGFVKPTIPGRPSSRLQKYRLTNKGRASLAKEKS